MKNKYGLLKIIKRVGSSSGGHILFECLCKCGVKTNVTKSRLLSGHTKSCGCLAADPKSKIIRNLPFGYRIWRRYHDIKTRCTNKKSKSYINYGGRGIKMCEEWSDDVEKFYRWSISNGFKPELTIDRIDVNGNYTPTNCRWIPKSEQAKNRRNAIVYKGKNIIEWGAIVKINPKTIYARIKKGWGIKKAILTPLK